MTDNITTGRVPVYKKPQAPKRTSQRLLYFILLLCSLFGLLFIKSSLWRAQFIDVVGRGHLTVDQIVDSTGITERDSLLGLSVGTVEEQLLVRLPQLKAVEVRRVFPGKVRVVVTERAIIGKLEQHQAQPVWVLEGGVKVSNQDFTAPDVVVPTFIGWNNNEGLLAAVTTGLSHLDPELLREFASVRWLEDKPDQIQIKTHRQHTIHIKIKDINEKLKYYSNFLKHPRGELYLFETICFSPR